MRRLLTVCIALSIGLFSQLFRPAASLAAVPTSIQGLHVSGNQILNDADQPIRLLGVNRSGGEFMCIQNRGIWDGPVNDATIEAMLTWHINAVRVPLNEDCWLNINGVEPANGGENYQKAVVDFVKRLNDHGLIVILDLHWAAPGTTSATKQTAMPNSDHSPAFWELVAQTFKSNSSVIFDLFNEPFPDSNEDSTTGWKCWRDGGKCRGVAFDVAGMQTLVTTIRKTGATNIIMLGGLRYSAALSQWLDYKPDDPTGNLAASWHSYNFTSCADKECWENRLLPVLEKVPLIAGEIGENDCAHGYIDKLMSWLDDHNVGYLAWTWDAWEDSCAKGPVLITDYNGTPTAFGQGFKDHLTELAQKTGMSPTASP